MQMAKGRPKSRFGVFRPVFVLLRGSPVFRLVAYIGITPLGPKQCNLTAKIASRGAAKGEKGANKNPTGNAQGRQDALVLLMAVAARAVWEMDIILCKEQSYYERFWPGGPESRTPQSGGFLFLGPPSERAKYEYDLLLWAHPCFHIASYIALTRLITMACEKNIALRETPMAGGPPGLNAWERRVLAVIGAGRAKEA